MYVLKQQKRPHKKIEVSVSEMIELKNNVLMNINHVGDGHVKVDNSVIASNKGFGDRLDNGWLQYHHASRPLSKEQWDKPFYQHQRYIGYYTWPK